MKEIHVPAEAWWSYAELNNCARLAGQKSAEIVSVQAFEFGGYLHMPYGCMYGPHTAKRPLTLETYRLLPEDLLEGTTTVYHDSEAIASGRRERGDLSGLIVSIDRARMTCAFKVAFNMDLPSQHLSLQQAKAAEMKFRNYGWRSFFYKGVKPTWLFLDKHPVARYIKDDDPDSEKHVLFWRHEREIKELTVDNSYSFTAPTDSDYNGAANPEPQMALF